MSLKVVETRKNPLLKREEVEALLEHAGKPTPKRDEILPSLVKVLRAKKELILIDKIFSVKGKGESRLKVLVYSKKDDIPKEKLEIIKKRSEKKKEKKEEPAPEAPEGVKEDEAPKEEAKPEEEKEEEKKEEPAKEEAKEEKAEEEKQEGKKE